jgi:hypothetical protein
MADSISVFCILVFDCKNSIFVYKKGTASVYITRNLKRYGLESGKTKKTKRQLLDRICSGNYSPYFYHSVYDKAEHGAKYWLRANKAVPYYSQHGDASPHGGYSAQPSALFRFLHDEKRKSGERGFRGHNSLHSTYVLGVLKQNAYII